MPDFYQGIVQRKREVLAVVQGGGELNDGCRPRGWCRVRMEWVADDVTEQSNLLLATHFPRIGSPRIGISVIDTDNGDGTLLPYLTAYVSIEVGK